jgi:hypothetical protein
MLRDRIDRSLLSKAVLSTDPDAPLNQFIPS